MSDYMQEPLAPRRPDDRPAYSEMYAIFDANGIHIASVCGGAGPPRNYAEDLMVTKARKRRIIAAVNACASIPTEDLEAIALQEHEGAFRALLRQAARRARMTPEELAAEAAEIQRLADELDECARGQFGVAKAGGEDR